MSLINQMLQDLDKRAPVATPSEDGLLSGVTPATGRRRHRGLFWLGLLVVLLAGTGIAWWNSAGAIDQPATMEIPAAVPEAAAAVRQASAQRTEPPSPPANRTPGKVIETHPQGMETAPAALESLYLSQVGDRVHVSAVFSRMPVYRFIRRGQGRQLALELPAGTKTISLPDSEIPPPLRKMAYETAGDRTNLVFSFDHPCRYDDLRVTDNPDGKGHRLQFVVRSDPSEIRPAAVPAVASAAAPPATSPVASPAAEAPTPAPAAPPPAAGTFVRQAVHPTARQRAEDLYQDGMAAFRTGRLGKAEQALRQALAIAPGHLGARDALIHLLDRQGRSNQVDALLAEGLKAMPDYLPYRIRFVHRLIEEGDLSRARSELTHEPLPPAAEAPDLYAMLATVNLRQSRYREAAKTYRALLAINPGQAVWWMGLGIALEGDAAFKQARQAYTEALSHAGLSEGLRHFIRKRLASSGNAQTGKPSTDKAPGKERS